MGVGKNSDLSVQNTEQNTDLTNPKLDHFGKCIMFSIVRSVAVGQNICWDPESQIPDPDSSCIAEHYSEPIGKALVILKST
jgi:hypothetical protein